MVAIPEKFIKSAIFLSVAETDENGVMQRVPKATAFLVSVPIEGTTNHVGYFVTARHCLYEARAAGHDEIHLRLNRRDGGNFEEFPTKLHDWHASMSADVAAIPFVPARLLGARSFYDFDHIAFNTNYFVGPGPDYRFVGEASNIGAVDIQPKVGNEIYHIGLFTQHYGKERNLPVARFGHISRMPSVIEFRDPDGSIYESPAYLAEFHSWGGHSGSPVYFLEPQTVITLEVDENGKDTGRGRTDYAWISGFLGMVSGHYDISKEGKVAGTQEVVETALNSGIATVVPAEAIGLLLVGDDLVKHRADLRREMESKIPRPTSDFAGPGPSVEFTIA